MKLAENIPSWTIQVEHWLKVNATTTRHDVKTGRDAWIVAHRAGVTHAAYDLSRDVTDGHIQSALERVFPNAVFQDRKVY